MMQEGVNYARLCEIMRDYAISCEGTRKNASLASACEAPFCARVASSHAIKYALTPLDVWIGRLPLSESVT